MRIAILFVLVCGLCFGQSAYRWSVAAYLGANAADAATSWQLREGNPILSHNGRFDSRSLAMKSALTGAYLGTQYYVVRKHPERKRAFTIVNWISVGVYTGVAIHNARLRH